MKRFLCMLIFLTVCTVHVVHCVPYSTGQGSKLQSCIIGIM